MWTMFCYIVPYRLLTVCLVFLSVCLCVRVVKRFSANRYFYSFNLIVTKLGTHDLSANMQKILEQIFAILIQKFLVHFLNFMFGLNVWNSSSGAM